MIYIWCPSGSATGGTELAHQLFAELKSRTQSVKLLYSGEILHGSPIPERFAKYNVEYTFEMDDLETNCIICPEVWVKRLPAIRHARKIIWWMSVDNFLLHAGISRGGRLLWLKGILKFEVKYRWLRNGSVVHFVQSEYAKKFLCHKRIRSQYLSDKIGEEYLANAITLSQINDKENIVLYNPQKGIEFTRKIIDAAPDISFIPIENMTPSQISRLCIRSKIYVDFGNHPGKDRFPREAAISGCVIFTGKRGSANNSIDIPIPDDYKFTDTHSNIERIVFKIRDVFANYNAHFQAFDEYRTKIAGEPKVFAAEVENAWVKIFSKYGRNL